MLQVLPLERLLLPPWQLLVLLDILLMLDGLSEPIDCDGELLRWMTGGGGLELLLCELLLLPTADAERAAPSATISWALSTLSGCELWVCRA